MHRVFLFSAAMILSLSLISSASFAADACKTDADCKAGDLCILALTPHVCKPPQAAGAACKRDVV
ncbi:MAG: Dickkopf N-terminal cysteine-rich domain-containing protein [Methylocella sp.]